jgi:hypothetical protein
MSAARVKLYSAFALAVIVTVLLLTLNDSSLTHGQEAVVSAEEELAARHAPVLLISALEDCYPNGGYDPAAVEIVLDQPANSLFDDQGQLVTRAPGASDVFDQPRRYYINWPGNPKNPGCGYERRYRELRVDLPVVAYAHLAREEGVKGVAVQYWFFYFYNDFLNVHEGDWEMIQVVYDEAETPEQALDQEPTRLAYSGHAGGEQASWSDRKVRTEGSHPVVYVARGSHAAYFESGTYLGVAKAGTVFGCDYAESPFRQVSPEIVLLPDEAGREDPLAWIEYDGMWGEDKGTLYSGPTGPKERGRWDKPISWTNDLRHFSERISSDPVVGLDPLGPVCTVIGWGSQALIWYREHPFVVAGGVIGMVVASASVLGSGIPDRLTRTSRRGLAQHSELRPASIRRPGFLIRPRTSGTVAWGAIRLYSSRPLLFVGIGAVFIPFAALLGIVQALLGTTWLEDRVDTVFMEPVFMAAVSSFGALVATVTAGAATAAAIGELDAGRKTSALGAYRLVQRRMASVAGANAGSTAVVAGLALTVVGLPLAINRLISWAFVNHEVMLHEANAIGALHSSGAHVSGNWWRCVGILVWVGLLVAIPGPAIAFAFLVFTEPPVTQSVHVVNMALYAGLLLPLSGISSTLLFGDLVWRRDEEEARRARERN